MEKSKWRNKLHLTGNADAINDVKVLKKKKSNQVTTEYETQCESQPETREGKVNKHETAQFHLNEGTGG